MIKYYEGRVVIGPYGDIVAAEDFEPSGVTEEQILQGLMDKLKTPVDAAPLRALSGEDIKSGTLVGLDHRGLVRAVRPDESRR